MVSVIIPLYNAEEYIKETVLSVINQTYHNWELIIIDDGSTDESATIVKEFCKKNKKINYSYQENSGVSVARNNGIQQAKGEFIFFLDADDAWKSDNLSIKIDFFNQNEKIYWTFGALELINKNGERLNQIIKGEDCHILKSLLLWDGNIITAPSTIAIRYECSATASFDENLSTAADQDFAIQLSSKYEGRYINSPSVLYRVLPNSMSRNVELMEVDHISVYKKAEENNLFKSLLFKQLCFSNLYWILAGSWWKNGNNKLKGLKYIFLALLSNPLSIVKLFNKFVK